MSETNAACAQEILETVPVIMAVVRAEMRLHREPASLSVPQFRTMLFLGRKPGASLNAVVDHIGLTAPSISKMIDGLVRRGLVDRRGSRGDRRQVELWLTREGMQALSSTRRKTRARLQGMLAGLTADKQAAVADSMQILRTVFRPETEPAGRGTAR